MPERSPGTSTADCFLDAMAARRHVNRIFHTDKSKAYELTLALALDDESMGGRFMVGAKMIDGGLQFVDGSRVKRHGGGWRKC